MKNIVTDVLFCVLVVVSCLAASGGAMLNSTLAKSGFELLFGTLLLPAVGFLSTILSTLFHYKPVSDPDRSYRWLFVALGIALPIVPTISMLIERG